MKKAQVKPSILVSTPLVWGIRNVLRSGLYEDLSEDFNVILVVPEKGKDSLIDLGISADKLWISGKEFSQRRLYRWVFRVLVNSHKYRYPTPSDRIFEQWFTCKEKWNEKVARTPVEFIGKFASILPLYNWLKKKEIELSTHPISHGILKLVRDKQPILGLSTTYVDKSEWFLFRALQTLGIPTITHMLSFDNLTSRGYLPIDMFSNYLVWQPTMANELMSFYDVPPEKITITGTPQFDFHIRKEFIWSREYTLTKLDVLPSKPYFLYCANHLAITPNEPDLVIQVIEAVSRNLLLKDHDWVVRLHPMDNYRRWLHLQNHYKNIHISTPWSHNPDNSGWAIPNLDDIALLGNSLRYASAVLNIASTIALDSAVVDIPVICIGFHPTANRKESNFYFNAHFTSHYLPIINSQAIYFAKSMDELLQHLEKSVQNPKAQREQRKQLVNELCGTVDGHSTERISNSIRKVLYENNFKLGSGV